ncbi:MAG TPA: TetR/AcrR family transcriptional regulator [Gammaproteobacteria bacterium]|jgi:AcrR family transcriptional regulator|nr:TetR/AcrR family transcriptional regulator [Gammaproteobacteria bacterium]
MIKGEITRASILRHAVSVASVHGLDGLTIGRLAERSGLSKSGLFGHFGSKDALKLAVLEAVVEDFRARVILPALREPTGTERLRRLFTAWLEWAAEEQRDGGCPLLGASIELDDQPGALRDYLVEKQKAWLDCIARITHKAIDERELRADLDVEQFAFELNSIGLGFNFAHRLLADRRARARAVRAFESLLASAST